MIFKERHFFDGFLSCAGCFKGEECRHCHFCNAEEAKARRRQLQQAARRQKRRRMAVSESFGVISGVSSVSKRALCRMQSEAWKESEDAIETCESSGSVQAFRHLDGDGSFNPDLYPV